MNSRIKITFMKDFFKDIFEYHNHYNQKLIIQLIGYNNQLPERTFQLFYHSINAQKNWNEIIKGSEKFTIAPITSIEECTEIDNYNFKETMKIVDERELDEIIRFRNSNGTEFTNSIQEILFHVANHFTHHRGQIISDFRQSGIEPIRTDYIFYKR